MAEKKGVMKLQIPAVYEMECECDPFVGIGEGCTCETDGTDPAILERLDRIENKLIELEDMIENCDCCDCEENPDDPKKPGPGIINVVRNGQLVHSWPAGSDASVAIYSKDYAQAGDTIYIGEGTFECSTLLYRQTQVPETVSLCHTLVSGVNVVGVPGKTKVIIRNDILNASSRDNQGIFSGRYPNVVENNVIKNVIYKNIIAPKTYVWGNPLFRWAKNVQVVNCVLLCSGTSPNLSFTYYNGGDSAAKLINCTLISEMGPGASHSGIGSSSIENCAYNKNIITLANGATVANAYGDLAFDPATYRITSDDSLNATCGVYSGPEAWPWP